jgi:hypothetical protein
MITPVTLERGKPYPLPLSTQGEGAAAQFLIKGGNLLQIVIHNMNDTEKWALSHGDVKMGLLSRCGAILLLFQFCAQNKRPALVFDCPFDLRLIPFPRLKRCGSIKALRNAEMIFDVGTFPRLKRWLARQSAGLA